MPDLKGGTRFAALRRFPSVAKRTGRPSGSLSRGGGRHFWRNEGRNPEPVPPHRYGAGPEKAMKPLKINSLRVGTPEGIKGNIVKHFWGRGAGSLMTCVVVRSLRSPPSPRSH